MKKIVMVLVAIVMMTGIAYGEFVDDFEDGDFLNPTWTNVNGNSIVSDPTRPNNHVLQFNNDPFYTTLSGNDTVPWYGFDFRAEHFIDIDVSSGGYFHIRSDDYVVNMPFSHNGYGSNFGVSYDDGIPKLIFLIYNSMWVEFHLWHDVETNVLNFELTEVDGELLGQWSVESVDITTKSNINMMGFWKKNNNVHYFDAFALTPEPTTIALFVVGGLFLRRNRK